MVVAIIAAYLLGSIPNAFIIGKLVGRIDIRQHGSGNVGATNVFRTVGKTWGSIAFALDVLKGLLATTLLANHFQPGLTQGSINFGLLQLSLGITAILGHVYPVWLKFKGGKGVATSCGVFLGIFPKAVLASLLIWIIVARVSRYVSLASLIAITSFLLWIFIFYRNTSTFSMGVLASALLLFFIFYTHRPNIKRLLNGTENKIGAKKNNA